MVVYEVDHCQELPVGVQVVVDEFNDAVHVPRQDAEVERRFFSTSLIHPNRRFCSRITNQAVSAILLIER